MRNAFKYELKLAPSTSWHWPLVSKKAKEKKESKCTSPLSPSEVHTSSNLPSLVLNLVNKHAKLGAYFIHACRHIGDDKYYYIEYYHEFGSYSTCMHECLNDPRIIIKKGIVGYSMAIVSTSTIAEEPMRWCEVVAMWVNVNNLPKLEVAMLRWQYPRIWLSSPSCSSFKCRASYI